MLLYCVCGGSRGWDACALYVWCGLSVWVPVLWYLSLPAHVGLLLLLLLLGVLLVQWEVELMDECSLIPLQLHLSVVPVPLTSATVLLLGDWLHFQDVDVDVHPDALLGNVTVHLLVVLVSLALVPVGSISHMSFPTVCEVLGLT